MATPEQINVLATAAADYRDLGWKVFATQNKKPAGAGMKDWPNREFTDEQIRWKLAHPDNNRPGIGVQMGPKSGIVDVEWDTAGQRAKAFEIFGDVLDRCLAFGRPSDPNHEHRLLKFDSRLELAGVANIYVPCGEGEPLIIRVGAGGKGTQSEVPPSPNKEWLPGRSPFDPLDWPTIPEDAILKLLTVKPPVEQSASVDESKLLDDETTVAEAVEAMIYATKNMEDGTDGSKRKYTCVQRGYDFCLTPAATVVAFRQYEEERPFRRHYSDDNLLADYRGITASGRPRERDLDFGLAEMLESQPSEPATPVANISEMPPGETPTTANADSPKKPEVELPPDIAQCVFDNPLGRYILATDEITEANKNARLVDMVVKAGNYLGNGAYLKAGQKNQYMILFAVLVGRTGKGRKGTVSATSGRVFERLDAGDGIGYWSTHCVVDGIGSGEALVTQLADEPDLQEIDKRKLIESEEYVNILIRSSMDGSTLSGNMRKAFDRKKLQTVVKKENAWATDYLLSCVGHITQDELFQRMPRGEMLNGNANRHLWVLTHRQKVVRSFKGVSVAERCRREAIFDERSKECADVLESARNWLWSQQPSDFKKVDESANPESSEAAEPAEENVRRPITEGVEFSFSEQAAQTLGEFEEEFDAYLDETSTPELIERAFVIVQRMALVFAVIDRTRSIEARHVEAALGIWRYCQTSAERIFDQLPASIGDKTVNYKIHEIWARLFVRKEGSVTVNQACKAVEHLPIDRKTAEKAFRAFAKSRDCGEPTFGDSGRPSERYTMPTPDSEE